MSAAQVKAADERLSWAGRSLAAIAERWDDEGPSGRVLALCGETRIPARLDAQTLEALRVARADVQHLLKLVALVAEDVAP